jgi:predicted nucleic acid-binding protein
MVTNDFRNKIVFLDTAPLIYFIEGNSLYQNKLKKLFEYNDKGNFRFITSTITLLEVLVKPMRDGQKELADKYKSRRY